MKTTDNLGKQQIKDFGGQYIDEMYSKTLGTNGQGEQTSSQTSSEQLFDRVSDGLIDEVNSTQGDYFLRITENAGYAAYGSELFVAHMDFHTTKEEFDRRTNAPWPKATKGMLINGQHRPGKGGPPQSSLVPNPPPLPTTGGTQWTPTPLGKNP